MKYRVLSLLSMALIVAASASNSQDRITAWNWIVALQTRLAQDGFYHGDLDGAVGPATKHAISEYARQKGVADGIESVTKSILASTASTAYSDQSDPTPFQIEQARSIIGEKLRDAESARFRNERAFKSPEALLICGEVNGKNVYGAYVGFQAYAITFTFMDFPMEETPPGEPNIFHFSADMEDNTDEMCAMGTSFGAFVLNK